MIAVVRSGRGERSLRLRLAMEYVLLGVRPRDKVSHITGIYNWFMGHFLYMNDPVSVEQVKDPERLLEEIARRGVAVGDCDDAATFLVSAFRCAGIPAKFVRVGFGKAPLGRREGPFTHVFVGATDQFGRMIMVDPVADDRTPEMLGRVKQIKVN